MKTVVTGKFRAERQAACAVDKLLHACLRGEQIRTFFVKPTPRARLASVRRPEGMGAPYRASLQSAAVELDVGPPMRAGGVRVTTYVGGLPLGLMRRQTAGRGGGIVVAVETPDRVSQVLAVNVLREHGAEAIQRTAVATHRLEPGCQPVPLSALLTDSSLEPAFATLSSTTRH